MPSTSFRDTANKFTSVNEAISHRGLQGKVRLQLKATRPEAIEPSALLFCGRGLEREAAAIVQ